MSGPGRPFKRGEGHPGAQLTARIVAQLRRTAKARGTPRGWIMERTKALGVSGAAISMAIGGQSWPHVKEPPVPPHERWKPGRGSRRVCPACGRPRYYRRCLAVFHTIDHRRETSAANGRARRVRKAA